MVRGDERSSRASLDGSGADASGADTTARAGAADQPRRPGLTRARSWMVVTPVDLTMIMLPALVAVDHLKALMCTAVLGVALVNKGRTYRSRLHISVLDELPYLLSRLLTAIALVAVVTALRHEQAAVTSFLATSVWILALFVLGRYITMAVLVAARRRRIGVHNTLLVGGGELATELARIMTREPRYGLAVRGYLDDDPHVDAVEGTPWLGGIGSFATVIATHKIDTVLLTGRLSENEHLIDFIRWRPPDAYDLLVVSRLHQFHSQDGFLDHIGAIPVMHINNPARTGLAWAVKRGLDIVISALALVFLAPLLLACALAVRLEGGPGVLFRQERVGSDGRVFECLKFRSMKPTDTQESATQWSIAGDPRVGPVGRILRSTSFDELPQLWNILRGDMTLVGPRPERPHFVTQFCAEIPHYSYRHRVPGGLTGLAQVSGLRGNTPINDRARFDNYYIENWSLWMDVKILLRTVTEVFSGKIR